MSTTKEIKQKVKASSLEERIAHLEELRATIGSIKYDMEYWLKEANDAEEGSTWWSTCWRNYNTKLWLKQRLEEIAEEA